MGVTSKLKRGVTVGTMDGLLAGRWQGSSTAGQAVNRQSTATIPAIHRAWSFAASAVAVLTMGVWRGEGIVPERVLTTPQSRLFRGVPNPTQDWYRFWYTVAKSLEARNNAYVWKTRNTLGQVIELTALHPDQVAPFESDGALRYSVMMSPLYPKPRDMDGNGFITASSAELWHIRGDGGIGEHVPPTPIQTFAASIGIALAKQDYESSLYQNGVLGGTAVVFPATVSREAAAAWKEVWNSQNAGTSNAATTKVLGGGATVTQIGMTQRDAQFVEAGHMTLLDVSNMTGVPLWVIGGDDKATTNVKTPEHTESTWVNHGLRSRLIRIQSSLQADPDIFGPAAKDYPAFDTANVIHPDSRTADDISHQQIQDGRIMPDEWRIPRGLPPLPDGLGMQPQVTPVGGAPNPTTPKEPANA